MMNVYKFRPEDFYRVRGKKIIMANVVGVILFTGIFVYNFLNDADSVSDDKGIFLLLSGCMIVLTLCVLSYKRYQKTKNAWLSFQLELDADGFSARQDKTFNLYMQRTEITGITEYRDKGLHIQTADKYRQCFIPAHVRGYEELRDCLSNWRSIESGAPGKGVYLNYALGILLGGAMVAVFASAEKYLVLPCAIAALILFTVSLWQICRNKYLDKRIKMRTCGIFLVVGMVIIMKMINVLQIK